MWTVPEAKGISRIAQIADQKLKDVKSESKDNLGEASKTHDTVQTLDKTISNLEMELAAARALQDSITSGSPITEDLKINELTKKRKYLMVIGINTALSVCVTMLISDIVSLENYHVMGNDSLFFCDQQYLQELLSFSAVILQSLIDTVLQEPIQAARRNLALDACNAIASSFEVCQGASDICSKLVETVKLSLSSNNKYLQSTIRFFNSRGVMQGESCKKQEIKLFWCPRVGCLCCL